MQGRQRDSELDSRPWLSSYDKDVPAHIDCPDATLPALLDDTSARYPDRTAIIFQGKYIPYSTFCSMVERFAASLQRLGVSKGDRVALFLPNSPQFVIAYYGILRAGAVAVPANPMYVERELLHLLEDSGAKTIVTLDSKPLFDKVNAVKQPIGLKRIIVSNLRSYLPSRLGIALPPAGAVVRMRDMLVGETPAAAAGPDVSHSDLAAILYTGGATGVPKGVCLTHHNLVANLLQCHNWHTDARTSGEVYLTVLPVFHAFSMTTSMNWPVYAGGTIILLPRFEAASLFRAIDKHRPTVLIGVPAVFHTILHHRDLELHDLTSLRLCVSGADALSAGVQQEFEHVTGCRLVQGYGLTEASAVVTCNPIQGKKKGIGLPVPDTDCRVVDIDTGATCPPDENGELIVRGPQVMREYCHNPEETARVFKGGWLYTGDIVRMDKDGYFEFIARKKDLIKVQKTQYITAYKVYPSEVEEMLSKHEGVGESAVIGVPDPLQGERVVAYVVRRPGSSLSAEELISFCRRYMAEYKVPAEIDFVSALPRNTVGKVLRNALRQRYMATRE